MKELVERFLRAKSVEGCTPRTLRAYQFELDRFQEFLLTTIGRPATLEDLCEDSVEEWLASRALESATRARMLASLRSFTKFLRERGVIEKNPLENLRTPRVKNKAISFLTVEEFQRLLEASKAPANAHDLPNRDFAILAMFMGSGIRLSELAQLRLQDVDVKAQQIKVVRKGGKGQYVPIGPSVIEALSAWLETRKSLHIPTETPQVFISNRRRSMSSQTIRDVVKKWMKKTGLWGKRMSPHTLRHSYATAQIAAGTPVQVVQELLGHNQLNTTSKYLHIVDRELRKAAEKIKF